MRVSLSTWRKIYAVQSLILLIGCLTNLSKQEWLWAAFNAAAVAWCVIEWRFNFLKRGQ